MTHFLNEELFVSCVVHTYVIILIEERNESSSAPIAYHYVYILRNSRALLKVNKKAHIIH